MVTMRLTVVEQSVEHDSIFRVHSVISKIQPVAVQAKLVRIANVDNLG